MSVFSLAEFAAKLVASDVNLKVAETEVIAKGCAMVAERAKDIVGVPQSGWPFLERSGDRTLGHLVHFALHLDRRARNERPRRNPARRPQLLPNRLRVVRSDVALGRIRVPCDAVSQLARLEQRRIDAVFALERLRRHVFGEVLRGLKETAHKLGETAEDFNEMFQGGDDDKR